MDVSIDVVDASKGGNWSLTRWPSIQIASSPTVNPPCSITFGFTSMVAMFIQSACCDSGSGGEKSHFQNRPDPLRCNRSFCHLCGSSGMEHFAMFNWPNIVSTNGNKSHCLTASREIIVSPHVYAKLSRTTPLIDFPQRSTPGPNKQQEKPTKCMPMIPNLVSLRSFVLHVLASIQQDTGFLLLKRSRFVA